jgi:CRP-like cAMP-binding protein
MGMLKHNIGFTSTDNLSQDTNMTIRIDKQRQKSAIAQTQNKLHASENERRQLRLQMGIAELHNQSFHILNNVEFVDALIEYLHREYQKKSIDAIRGILDNIGACACSPDRQVRERAVFILSVVAEKILKSDNYLEFLEVVSLHLVNWLQNETEYLSGFHFICLQLQTMIQNMLRLGLWYQTENLIIILAQIQKGVLPKPEIIRKIISQVHADLGEVTFLRKLVEVMLDTKEDRRDIAQCLLIHFGSKAADVMVQSLIDSQDKDKRFNLIEFIPAAGKSVVPICERCLKQDPPWFVIRNLVIIISRLGDQNLYEIVRPHLGNADIRVQMQILNCITKLGGPKMRDRLIEALDSVNDELKQQVILQLGSLGGREVGNALCKLLSKGDQFATHLRDELLLTILNKIKFEPSPTSLKAVKEFIKQRRQQVDEGDKILLAAQETLIGLGLKLVPEAEAKTRKGRAIDIPAPIVVPVATEEEFDRLLREQMTAIITSKKSAGATKPKAQHARQLPEKSVAAEKTSEQLPQSPEMRRHTQVWSDLYATMSAEENQAFRKALKFRTYQPGEMVVARGNIQASLHLFDSGIVRLTRNKSGEEAYFRDMGTGNLIGSEIFLSGEPWNLSLYAGKDLTAHIYNLENLLLTHIDLPNLADKILGFCSTRDILPGMLKALGASSKKFEETVRFSKRNGASEQIVIMQKLRTGLSFILPRTRTEKLGNMLRDTLEISIMLSSGTGAVVRATIASVIRTVANPTETLVFAHYDRPMNDALYLCQSVKMLTQG